MQDYQVDNSGYPIDPKMRKLQFELSNLAANWRGEPDRREEIKLVYRNVMRKLYSMGWDDILDVDAELPDRHMPKEYRC